MPASISDDYDLNEEKTAVRELLVRRNIPDKQRDNLLIATWNVENLGGIGSAKRRTKDHQLIAEMIRPFDIVAIQEVKSNLWGIREVLNTLNGSFKMLVTDIAGNSERLAYIYDSARIHTRELFAELAIPESERSRYDAPDIPLKFREFHRNPFLVSFERRDFDFTLANVHIYFGEPSGVEYRRRLTEVYALAKWSWEQVRSETVYDKDLILIGDMNVPKMDESNSAYRQLIRFGYEPTNWSTKVGTSLDGTQHFDQIAIYPSQTRRPSNHGVLNFDKHLFKSIWDRHNLDPSSESDLKKWRKYCERRISDHRPLRIEFSV